MILHRDRLFLNQQEHEFISVLLAPVVKYFQEFFFLTFDLNGAFSIFLTSWKFLQAIAIHQEAVHGLWVWVQIREMNGSKLEIQLRELGNEWFYIIKANILRQLFSLTQDLEVFGVFSKFNIHFKWNLQRFFRFEDQSVLWVLSSGKNIPHLT